MISTTHDKSFKTKACLRKEYNETKIENLKLITELSIKVKALHMVQKECELLKDELRRNIEEEDDEELEYSLANHSYKCDGGCGEVVGGSRDSDCDRICKDCMLDQEDEDEDDEDYGIGWSEGWIWTGSRWKWDGVGNMTQIPFAKPTPEYFDEDDELGDIDDLTVHAQRLVRHEQTCDCFDCSAWRVQIIDKKKRKVKN